MESVTDGSSNTGLFSEKLIGVSSGSPLPYAGNGTNAKRGGSLLTNLPDNYNSGNQLSALWPMQLPSVPGTTANGTSWILGFSWAINYEWYQAPNLYTHFNLAQQADLLQPQRHGWGLGVGRMA